MPTPEQVQRLFELSAIHEASDATRAWLDAPRPPPGAADSYAMNWYRAWMRILLRDLAVFDGVVITHEGAREILGLPDVALVAVLLDQLRRDDDEEPALTERDFARVAKSN